MFDHLVVTFEDGKMLPWHTEIKKITASHGVDIFFDPVASGDFLNTEIRALAQDGTIWLYGLLGRPGIVDVQPLIRKNAALRGWMLGEFTSRGPTAFRTAADGILDAFASGAFKQHIGATYKLADVVAAHTAMEKGDHIGKLVLIP
jgi:NADPH:quinone reductase-like Zn-dependent oxidoreductase